MNRRPDLRPDDPPTIINLESLHFRDDFDEYVARADSGGSAYGILKRHAFAHSSLRERSTASLQKPTQRQRSKSLISPESRLKCIADEKMIIEALCQQTSNAKDDEDRNTLRPQVVDYRRHSSSACMSTSPAATDLKRRSNYALPEVHVTHGSTSVKPHLVVEDSGDLEVGGCSVSVPVCRRRSFSVTPRGLINEGDEVIPVIPPDMVQDEAGFLQMTGTSRRSSYNSCEGGSGGQGSDGSLAGDSPIHRVLMLGGPGVGKTALTQQFITSEFMAAQNTSFDDGREITVPVLLDGEESIMEFIDLPYSGELNVWREYDVDGYIIVYSITDRLSYQKATGVLTAIKDTWNNLRPVILVANKSDLERSRMIGKEEGKNLAQNNDCKYIEVSAILNHKVDDLLVGMLKQIRLSLVRRQKAGASSGRHHPVSSDAGNDHVNTFDDSSNLTGAVGGSETGCLSAGPCRNGVFAKLFRGSRKSPSKSCENLLTS